MMRSLLSFVAVLGLAAPMVLSAAAVEKLTANGITLPIFDPTGKTLTHKLLAKRGTMLGPLQTLYGVELQLFSPTEPGVVVQKMEADDAVWDAQRQILTGKGEIVVTAADNRLRGQGFEFSMISSQLVIQRDFSLVNPELTLTSDRAIIDLVVEKNDKDVKIRDVGRCEAIGNLLIVATPQAAKKFGFEKATSDRAIYNGDARTITFPGPTHTIMGQYKMLSQEFLINLERPAKSLTPEKP
jgi:hypothetical protein